MGWVCRRRVWRVMKSEIVRRTRGWRRARRLESEVLVVEMRGVEVGIVGGMGVDRWVWGVGRLPVASG